jgi:general secretion pathway protein K
MSFRDLTGRTIGGGRTVVAGHSVAATARNFTVKADARDGIILVTVLWLIALLAILAVAASLTFRSFSGVVAVERERLAAEGLLNAGLEVAGGLVSTANDDVPLNGVQSTVTMASGVVRLQLNDEGGRIDIGQAPVELLTALMRAAGAPNPDVLAKEIVEWRDDGGAAPANPAQNATNAKPLAATFTDVNQLLQIPDMRPEWVAAAVPLTTVYGNATINPLTAPAAVIAALPGMTEDRTAAFLDARQNNPTDATRLTALLANAQSFVAVKAPQAVSVQISAVLNDGYSAKAEAVIVCLKGDRAPYRILAWKPSARQTEL